MTQGDGYRAGARPDPYDPSVRVRACDACGAGLVVNEGEHTQRCDACRHEQEVPEASVLAVNASPTGDEAERLAHLATQLDHQWLTPKSVIRFGANVLEEERGEARKMWAEIRRRAEEDRDDANTALELMCVTFALHGSLPAGTREERLARRALAESSAEAMGDPALRQKVLYNLVIGAIRSGAHAHAREWLKRMDPRSRSLDADSSYRILAGALAIATDDPNQALKVLGRSATEIPIHQSSRSFAAVLRATALEKLGDPEAAARGLYEEVKRRHSALAHMTEIVESLPDEWGMCKASLERAKHFDLDRLVANVPGRAGSAFVLAIASAVSVVGSLTTLPGIWAWLGGGVGAVLGTVAFVISKKDLRRRREIARGCVQVTGRVLAKRSTSTPGMYELDVVVERPDEPDLRVTTLQALGSRIAKMQLEGCTFDALWNPAAPTVFPRITIQVSGDDAKGD
jgi:hypothetical protein